MTAIKNALFAENFTNQFLLIEEVHGNVSADFLISSIIADQFRCNPNAGICLVLFQSTCSHYSTICRTNFKLSLPDLVQSNQIICIQAMESVVEALSKNETQNLTKSDDLSSLYLEIEGAVKKLTDKGVPHVYLVIESVSNLFYMAHPLKTLMNLVQNCYNFVLSQSASTLIISSHVCDSDSDKKLLLAFLKHLANIIIRVSGLKTGFSSEVSGSFIIEKKTNFLYSFSVKKDKFYFKLEDSSVIIYDGVAPNFLK